MVQEQKAMIDRNFVIKHFHVGYTSSKHIQQPSMFYKLKITQSHYEHTCKLSEVFYNQTIHVSRGNVKLNIDGMDALLVILKETSSGDPMILRP